ncbi:Poly [ADP-ribose] polymerase 1-like protein, partial [Dinothrombium tinctorium]
EKLYRSEYASSNHSRCRNCNIIIKKGELRLGAKVQSEKFDGKHPLWYHFDCFFIRHHPPTLSDIAHCNNLKSEDRRRIKSMIKNISRKREAEEQNSSEDSNDKALDAQSDLLHYYQTELAKMKRSEIVRLLEYNNQTVYKTNRSKYELLADCMVFGALERCPECNGQLLFRDRGYICCDYATNYSKCLFDTQMPKRKPFLIPENLKHNYKFLSDYVFVERKRLYHKFEPPVLAIDHFNRLLQPSSSLACKSENRNGDEQPLNGYKIAYCGKDKSFKQTLKDKISSLGAQLIDVIDDTVLFVVSNLDEIEKKDFNIRVAKIYDVPLVSEDIFKQPISNVDILALIKNNRISLWGGSRFENFEPSQNSMKHVTEMRSFKMKGKEVVDPDTGLDEVAHIYKDESVSYSVTLAKVELDSNKNSFYKIQLLEFDEPEKDERYIVYRSWGRIGTNYGDRKIEKFKEKSNAIENFCQIFFKITGNEWKKRREFEKHPGRYSIVETQYITWDEEFEMLKIGGSCLPIQVQELISMIFDIKRMKYQMYEFDLDVAKLPLGRISEDQISQAYSVLSTICEMINSNQSDLQKHLDTSNRFYSLIPHKFPNFIRIINSRQLLLEKLEVLSSLRSMKVAFQLRSDINESGGDLIKQHYDSLNVNIEALDENSEDFKPIQKYVKNTQGKYRSLFSLEIIDVFEVIRMGEGERFEKYKHFPNRYLLWHGSIVTNFAGILSKGLQIAPAEAPFTGQMFGKGIYFTDIVSYSAVYSRSAHDDICLLLLCEVALGNMLEMDHDDPEITLPEGKHSVKGVGKAKQGQIEQLPDGLIIPNGEPIEPKYSRNSKIEDNDYNQYVVYNNDQVKIKYLVKLKFNYQIPT